MADIVAIARAAALQQQPAKRTGYGVKAVQSTRDGTKWIAQSSNKRLSSRFRGVCWNKKNKRWQAAINSHGKYVYLGSFVSEDEAAAAFDRAAIRVRGNKAKLNFPQSNYFGPDGKLLPSILAEPEPGMGTDMPPGDSADEGDGEETSVLPDGPPDGDYDRSMTSKGREDRCDVDSLASKGCSSRASAQLQQAVHRHWDRAAREQDDLLSDWQQQQHGQEIIITAEQELGAKRKRQAQARQAASAHSAPPHSLAQQQLLPQQLQAPQQPPQQQLQGCTMWHNSVTEQAAELLGSSSPPEPSAAHAQCTSTEALHDAPRLGAPSLGTSVGGQKSQQAMNSSQLPLHLRDQQPRLLPNSLANMPWLQEALLTLQNANLPGLPRISDRLGSGTWSSAPSTTQQPGPPGPQDPSPPRSQARPVSAPSPLWTRPLSTSTAISDASHQPSSQAEQVMALPWSDPIARKNSLTQLGMPASLPTSLPAAPTSLPAMPTWIPTGVQYPPAPHSTNASAPIWKPGSRLCLDLEALPPADMPIPSDVATAGCSSASATPPLPGSLLKRDRHSDTGAASMASQLARPTPLPTQAQDVPPLPGAGSCSMPSFVPPARSQPKAVALGLQLLPDADVSGPALASTCQQLPDTVRGPCQAPTRLPVQPQPSSSQWAVPGPPPAASTGFSSQAGSGSGAGRGPDPGTGLFGLAGLEHARLGLHLHPSPSPQPPPHTQSLLSQAATQTAPAVQLQTAAAHDPPATLLQPPRAVSRQAAPTAKQLSVQQHLEKLAVLQELFQQHLQALAQLGAQPDDLPLPATAPAVPAAAPAGALPAAPSAVVPAAPAAATPAMPADAAPAIPAGPGAPAASSSNIMEEIARRLGAAANCMLPFSRSFTTADRLEFLRQESLRESLSRLMESGEAVQHEADGPIMSSLLSQHPVATATAAAAGSRLAGLDRTWSMPAGLTAAHASRAALMSRLLSQDPGLTAMLGQDPLLAAVLSQHPARSTAGWAGSSNASTATSPSPPLQLPICPAALPEAAASQPSMLPVARLNMDSSQLSDMPPGAASRAPPYPSGTAAALHMLYAERLGMQPPASMSGSIQRQPSLGGAAGSGLFSTTAGGRPDSCTGSALLHSHPGASMHAPAAASPAPPPSAMPSLPKHTSLATVIAATAASPAPTSGMTSLLPVAPLALDTMATPSLQASLPAASTAVAREQLHPPAPDLLVGSHAKPTSDPVATRQAGLALASGTSGPASSHGADTAFLHKYSELPVRDLLWHIATVAKTLKVPGQPK